MPMSSESLVTVDRSRKVAGAVTITCAVSRSASVVSRRVSVPGRTVTSWSTAEAKLGRWKETSQAPAARPSIR